MSWQQLFCRTHKENEQAVSLFLEENDATSITYQDAEDKPVLEPLPGETPLWDLIVITGLFSSDINLEPIATQLQQQLPEVQKIHYKPLKEQQWERTWMDSFKPMKFGNNLWIYPTYFDLPDDGSTQILLDPGLAFGTGTHPTTSLCLEWLDNHPPKDLMLIDYGCGSGVLAIAAIKLGAKHVLATDIDSQAFTATKNNMLTNQINNEEISTYLPKNLPKTPVNIILANILSGPLTELAPHLSTLVKPNGKIVLSGILIEQEESIIHSYTPFFTNLLVVYSGDWIRVTGIRI